MMKKEEEKKKIIIIKKMFFNVQMSMFNNVQFNPYSKKILMYRFYYFLPFHYTTEKFSSSISLFFNDCFGFFVNTTKIS
jgi:hypothetical protein